MRIFLSCSLALILSALATVQALSAADSKAAPLVGPGTKEPGPRRFVENDNGTVLDKESGLMWLTDANIETLPVPWQAAKQYVQDMNSGARPNYGYTNWRLPTISDLETLVDKAQSYPALPRRHPFVNVQNDLYWSSSTGSDIVEYVWTLDMAAGNRIVDHRSYCNFRFFWPVRNTWNTAAPQQGTVFTGGVNKNGQLGDGTAEDRASFMPVSGLSGVIKVAAGVQHVIAITADGTVWAWGDNSEGQLGRSGSLESRTPALVEGLRTVVDAAAGMNHSVALKADGTVWAWGQNAYGQLGAGDIADSRVPVQVRGLSQVVKIAAGMYHSVALKADGTVWAWGQNTDGQLGAGDIAGSRSPVRVKGLSQVAKIAAGMNHTLAVKADGTVWTWGQNLSGQLGDGTRSGKPFPVQVAGLSRVVDVAAGQDHSLALKADGTVWAWGSNEYNQLGSVAAPQVLNASPVEGASKARKIAAGMYHSVAVLSDGMISLWGKNLDSFGHKSRPYAITYVKDIFDAAAGKYYTVVLSGQDVNE